MRINKGGLGGGGGCPQFIHCFGLGARLKFPILKAGCKPLQVFSLPDRTR